MKVKDWGLTGREKEIFSSLRKKEAKKKTRWFVFEKANPLNSRECQASTEAEAKAKCSDILSVSSKKLKARRLS